MKRLKIGDEFYHWFVKVKYIPITNEIDCNDCYFEGKSRCRRLDCWNGVFVKVNK